MIARPLLRQFNVEDVGEIECPAAPVRELRAELERVFGPGEQVLEWARGE